MTTPFRPQYGATQSALVGTSAGAITGLSENAEQLHLLVVGTQVVFVRVTRGDDTTNATTADLPVYPNVPVTISKNKGADSRTRLSHIAAGAGSTLYVTPGDGSI